MTSNPLFRTVVIAALGAGAAFFTASWADGYQTALQTAGASFFVTGGTLLAYLGWDARKPGPGA